MVILCTLSAAFAGTEPRPKPADYEHHAAAGAGVSLAADFHGRGVPGPDGGVLLKNYVVVEAALFLPPGQRAALSTGQFRLKFDNRPAILAASPGEVAMQIRLGDSEDPQQSATVQMGPAVIAIDRPRGEERFPGDPMPGGRPRTPKPPGSQESKESSPAETPWDLIKRVAIDEGEMGGTRAGMIYFRWREKLTKSKSIVLIYDGPAGRLTLPLK